MTDVMSKVMTVSEYQELLNKAFDGKVTVEQEGDGIVTFVDYEDAGFYVGGCEDNIQYDELHERLAKTLGVDEVMSVHTEGEYPLSIWVAYRDHNIIKKSDYVAVRLYTKDDIKDALIEYGLEGSEAEIDIVADTKFARELSAETDAEFFMTCAIEEAIENGALISPEERHANLTNKLRNSLKKYGDTFTMPYRENTLKVVMLENVTPNCEDELWFGGDVAELYLNEKKICILTANGDVIADILRNGQCARIKDKNNGGEFGMEIKSYIKNDEELRKALNSTDSALNIQLEAGNWFEAYSEHDSFVAENSDGIYEAIAEIICNLDWFLEE